MIAPQEIPVDASGDLDVRALDHLLGALSRPDTHFEVRADAARGVARKAFLAGAALVVVSLAGMNGMSASRPSQSSHAAQALKAKPTLTATTVASSAHAPRAAPVRQAPSVPGASPVTTVTAAAPATPPAMAVVSNTPSVSEAAKAIAFKQVLPPVVVTIGGQPHSTLHPIDRVRLCKSIAHAEEFARHGLTWRHVYAVIDAETDWAARSGMGLNKRSSEGLAQLEAPTAKALGVTDAKDPVQALLASARLIKQANSWARARKVPKEHSMAALSVFYNLSTSARERWASSVGVGRQAAKVSGAGPTQAVKTVALAAAARPSGAGASTTVAVDLPDPTKYHIANVANSMRTAAMLDVLHDRWDTAMRQAQHAQQAATVVAASRDAAVELPAPWSRTVGAPVQSVGQRLRDLFQRTPSAPSAPLPTDRQAPAKAQQALVRHPARDALELAEAAPDAPDEITHDEHTETVHPRMRG